MSSTPLPDLSPFDELDKTHLDTLARFSDLDADHDVIVGRGSLDATYLALTYLGLREACWTEYARQTPDPEAEYDCPFQAVIEAMGLPYASTSEEVAPEEYWGGMLSDNVDDGNTLVVHSYFVAHDPSRVEWFESAHPDVSDDPHTFNERIGRELGYPDSAVEAHFSVDGPHGQVFKEYLSDHLDDFDLDAVRHVTLVPYVPALDPNEINQAARDGMLYRDTIDTLSEEYECLEPMRECIHDQLEPPEWFRRSLSRIGDGTHNPDLDAFDALSEESVDQLHEFATDADETPPEVVHLIATLAGVRPACILSSLDPEAVASIVAEMGLSHAAVHEVSPDYPGSAEHLSIVGSDPEFVTFASEALASDALDDETHRRLGTGLGYPETAVEAFLDEDTEWFDDSVEDASWVYTFTPYRIPDTEWSRDDGKYAGGALIYTTRVLSHSRDEFEWLQPYSFSPEE